MWRGVVTFKRASEVSGSLDPKAQVLRLNHHLGSLQGLSALWQPPCREALLELQSHVPPRHQAGDLYMFSHVHGLYMFSLFYKCLGYALPTTKASFLFFFHLSHAVLVFLA